LFVDRKKSRYRLLFLLFFVGEPARPLDQTLNMSLVAFFIALAVWRFACAVA
jgi:hypothetical protein